MSGCGLIELSVFLLVLFLLIPLVAFTVDLIRDTWGTWWS